MRTLRIDLTKIDEETIERIKRAITEIGRPIIPLTQIFEYLGFSSIRGLAWGILAGAVSAIAVGMGYEVQRRGRSIFLVKRGYEVVQRVGRIFIVRERGEEPEQARG